MRTNLLISVIFNFIASLIWISGIETENQFMVLGGAFLIISGVILISYSKLTIKDLYPKKGLILALAILLLPFNFISSIILFVDTDSIGRDYKKYKNSNPEEIIENQENKAGKEKQTVSKEIKKVDSLLKIGVTMVAIAGAMIVTTSWDSITDVLKMVLLIIIGVIFLGLSKFSEIRLKIKNTTLAYWLLSMIAFALSAFVVGYGELLGDWFCFNGDGSSVCVSTFLLIVSALSYLTYRKFKFSLFIYLAYICLVASIIFIIAFLSETPEMCVLIIACILLILNVLPKMEGKEACVAIKKCSLVATYILTALIAIELRDITEDIVIVATLIVQLISLIVLAIREKTDIAKILSSIGIIVLSTIALNELLTETDKIVAMLITRGSFIIMISIICLTIVRDTKTSNILLSIALPLALLSMMDEINILIGIFVGIIALIMIIFGYVFKDFKAIYIEGIIITVLNIIVQLWEFWGEIPAWVYLLVGGLLLIGIVTAKELKKPNDE